MTLSLLGTKKGDADAIPSGRRMNRGGYLVVRLPEFNDSLHGCTLPRILTIGNARYHGVDRMPWEDIYEEFDGGTLPTSLRAGFDSFRTSETIPLCPERELA